MLDWLKEHWEFVVGTAIGLPGLVALYFQRRPSAIDYKVTHTAPLLSKHNSILNVPLTVNYLGNPMEDPYLLRLRIINSGKHAVTASDYAKPITIEVHGAEVYDVSVPEMSPPDLIDLFNDAVPPGGGQGPLRVYGFKPKLLNPGDWFDVQEVLEGKPLAVEVSARFTNQSRAMADTTRRSQDRWAAGLVTVHLASLAIVTVLVTLGRPDGPLWAVSLSLLVFLSAIVLPMYFEFIASRMRRRKQRREQRVAAAQPQ